MTTLRWIQRFENFEKAYQLLKEPFISKKIQDFSQLEQEGLIQRFEFCFELGWKTLKDYLIYQGIEIDPVTPRQTIKQAFAAQVIISGQTWIEMLEKRNLLSHTYNRTIFESSLQDIQKIYLNAFEELYRFLSDKNQAAS